MNRPSQQLREQNSGQSRRLFCPLLLLLVMLSSGCGSSPSPTPTSTPSPTPSSNTTSANNQSTPTPTPALISSLTPAEQLTAVLAETVKINDRLRYYGEEIKTTYKPEKQVALFNSVRTVVQPGCQQIQQLAAAEKISRPEIIKIANVCGQLDAALAAHELKQIQAALREFNPALKDLQRAAGVPPVEEKKKE